MRHHSTQQKVKGESLLFLYNNLAIIFAPRTYILFQPYADPINLVAFMATNEKDGLIRTRGSLAGPDAPQVWVRMCIIFLGKQHSVWKMS